MRLLRLDCQHDHVGAAQPFPGADVRDHAERTFEFGAFGDVRFEDVHRRCRHAALPHTAQHGVRHIAAADKCHDHAVVLSRSPKIAVPMRTIVEPAAMAASRSADIPIDSVSQCG